MMKLHPELGLVLLILTCSGGAAGLSWKELRVTWKMNSSAAGAFDLMPFTTSEAGEAGWRSVSDCVNGGLFSGFRYVADNDPMLALLFDQRGYIAGIQMNLPVSELKNNSNSYRFDDVPAYVRNKIAGTDVYSLTAYFVQPDTICTGHRRFFQRWEHLLGTDLYLQNGPTSADYVQVPKKRDDNLSLGWSASKCFQAMGYHSFFGLATMMPTNCDYIFPYALNFDAEHGQLRGFAFTAVGSATSQRFEHPSTTGIVLTVGANAPQCLLHVPNTIGLTQLHVFFVKKPWELRCPA